MITCDPDPEHPLGFREKISSKGIQGKALNDILTQCKQSFGHLIRKAKQGTPTQVTNVGFRCTDKEGIRTYEQRKNCINTKYMKRRKFCNHTKPIMSTLTPYLNTLKTRKRPAPSVATEPQSCDANQDKRQRLNASLSPVSSVEHQSDSEQEENEVRRELGLDTNNLIEGSDTEEGIFLDDLYRY